MSFDPANELGGNARRLSSTLRKVGIGKLVLAVLILILAFTGYDTPRAVNTWLLIIGFNLLMLGGLCLSVSKAFGRAAIDPALVGAAMEESNKLFGYYLFLLSLAVLGVGFDTVAFLIRIVSR